MRVLAFLFLAAVLAARAQDEVVADVEESYIEVPAEENVVDEEHVKRESQAARMKARKNSEERRRRSREKEDRIRNKVRAQMENASKLRNGASQKNKPSFDKALGEKLLDDAGMSVAEVTAEAQFKVLEPVTDSEEDARAAQLEQAMKDSIAKQKAARELEIATAQAVEIANREAVKKAAKAETDKVNALAEESARLGKERIAEKEAEAAVAAAEAEEERKLLAAEQAELDVVAAAEAAEESRKLAAERAELDAITEAEAAASEAAETAAAEERKFHAAEQAELDAAAAKEEEEKKRAEREAEQKEQEEKEAQALQKEKDKAEEIDKLEREKLAEADRTEKEQAEQEVARLQKEKADETTRKIIAEQKAQVEAEAEAKAAKNDKNDKNDKNVMNAEENAKSEDAASLERELAEAKVLMEEMTMAAAAAAKEIETGAAVAHTDGGAEDDVASGFADMLNGAVGEPATIDV